MGAQDIPMEILVMIFKNLEAKEVVACRAVCRRWRDVVDSLSDEVWERYCCLDFWNPKAANRVSNLGFRELYKSLSLWSKVEKAELTCEQLPGKVVSHFKILNNNTLLVILQNELRAKWYHRLYFNQVEYYNMEDMKLISRERYDFYFEKYDENDKLIALIDEYKALCVIIKSNKKRFFVGKMYNNGNDFTLFDTEVYFVDIKEMICVSRLKVVDGEETIQTEELEEIAEHIIAFARATEKSVNMLTDEGNIYCYRHDDKDFETCTQIDSWTQGIIYELWEFGFHWSDPKIFEWVDMFDEKQVNITKFQSPLVIHSHNHVVLIGTSRGTVHIFKRPYKLGELVLYKARPNRSINMNEYSGADVADKPSKAIVFKEIQQLGIVEILNGHRLVVLTRNKLFFVDLLHKQVKANKRDATSLARAEASTSSKKKVKTAKKKHSQPKVGNNNRNTTKENTQKVPKIKKNRKTSNMAIGHVYNTRSKDKGSFKNK